MKLLFFILLPTLSFATTLPPTPFPVFLKSGYSSILEFPEPPTRVVLGSSENFKVERLNRSLVIKTLVPYASTNMFVYFQKEEPRLFLLTASEDANPTFYRKFDPPITVPPATSATRADLAARKSPRDLANMAAEKRGMRILSTHFDPKKDYLTIDLLLSADAKVLLKPRWEWVRLSYKGYTLAPMKLWSERREVQKDTHIKARFIFAKPNVPRNLNGVSLVVPLLGSPQGLKASLKVGAR